VLTRRVLSEWLVAGVLTAFIVLARGGHDQGQQATLLVALVALVVSPFTHALAVRWTFRNISLRRL